MSHERKPKLIVERRKTPEPEPMWDTPENKYIDIGIGALFAGYLFVLFVIGGLAGLADKLP